MGLCVVVAVLLRGKLWRRADCHHPPVHRATANASLRTGPKDGFAVRALTLHLKEEVRRAFDRASLERAYCRLLHGGCAAATPGCSSIRLRAQDSDGGE